MGRITDHLSGRFSSGNGAAMLVGVNVAVYLLVTLVNVAGRLFGHENAASSLTDTLVQLPCSLPLLMHRPWTMVTHIFGHFSFLHLLFNILWLYMFAAAFTECRSNQTLYGLYITGGIAGALFFVLAAAILPEGTIHGSLVGASGAVFAIVAATALLLPDYRINLLLLGPVKMKWLAFAMILFDLLGIAVGITSGNIAGNIAHLGGILTGVSYAMVVMRQQRSDKPAHKRTSATPDDAQTLDRLLDKIRRSGYASLTREEIATLLRISNKQV